ncbi:MAG: hypothetical protein ACK5LO_14930 [Leucobacter sp.]
MTHPPGHEAPEWALMRRHFSDERLRLYLTETGGDEAAAAHLYQWNSHCSAVFWEALGYVEVSLRNALDARMTLRQRARGETRHWVFDDARQLGRDARGPGRHSHPYQDVATAIRRVQANGKPLDPAQIISELPFGFWHQLVARRQMFLWPDLAAAFAHAPTRSPVPVRERLARMRDLRNRIGHHHRIWSLDLDARWDDLLTLTGWIDPELRDWIETGTGVPAVLAARP